MKAVKVEWLDICSGTPNWARIQDLEVGPLKCVSVGWLIKEAETYICIAQNYNEEERLVSDTMTFPKEIVMNVTVLEEKKQCSDYNPIAELVRKHRP